MPITKSAQKALRQSKKRKLKNTREKDTYRAAVKEFRKLIAQGKLDEAKAMLPKVYTKLDKTAKHGIIKKNKASRIKSRITKLLKK